MNENLKKNRTSVKLTSYPSIKNSPFPPVEGNGRFSNIELALAVTVVPYLIGKISLPFITVGFLSYAHIFLVIILGAPVAVLYWSINSYYWSASNQSERRYAGHTEYRHDWASFHLTPTLFKYVITRLIPEVILHTTSQDEEQVRDHYDRGDDFYRWFLGPRMVYTSGIVSDPEREESLEDLQDNKLKLVYWMWMGTLAAFAAKNYGCKVTGVTLGRNQAKFGNERMIAANGIPSTEPKGRFSKIVTLEMAEHVGIRRYPDFLKQVYDLLADDGTLVFQVAGIRTNWQYEDLIWGLFMNKYIFPGADASLNLGWVITKLEQAGFEVRAIDVLGVHYSATIWRWYKNWQSNAEKVKEKYGERWYRIWEFS
ncbi:cyclopropane-fatty-acyl-phospholipid synthase [Phakopsora pachyrhizi]|uniref:sphingolipid C(9)-methyltransferase n=1 Tax=Phakopsora pachyrhizi TaxID=170000 RepID=A0AAV0B2Z3_PHAPC|nr:cyclopropane-fatty-acyl-phospholipid synthase [Phakopsora pachyrhizi]